LEPAEADSEKPAPAQSEAPPAKPPRWKVLLQPDSRARRLLIGAAIYVVCVAVFAIVAGPRMTTHTPFHHFAHLADAWLHGRQDLRFGAPGYAMGNDFAEFNGKVYISFPPFPAVLMLPLVAIAGSPEDFRDGQFIVWLAGVGPAVLFLALEKLRRAGRSARTEIENAALALLFAFGTVYFFTAVQGTVWFAGHVVGVGLLSMFILFAVGGRSPLACGLLMACMWMTRPTMLLTAPLFLLEAARASVKDDGPIEGAPLAMAKAAWARLDKVDLAKKLALFAVPVLASFAITSWMNRSRFGDASPFAFGHEHLAWVRGSRLNAWGLFSFHYLGKNLAVMLTSLPYLPPKGVHAAAPFQINAHGLALWFTTPLYFWLLWPKKRDYLYVTTALAALGPLAMNLLYQNTGWEQFGYRFSNDYAPLLIVLLAIGGRRIGWGFRAVAVWCVAWNAFGAISFKREGYEAYYFYDRGTIHQPD
jgi:hypothetical protein